ncbi:GNAT family N-acetyltransferase [Croceivirga thetidis]|uniref:GNAT family N-acetyltransferase n=1 Tax=Croceivirga thetidis TaxID=2721623 RepID=A0ABX1GT40_9FLAO|nr:GNAT family N-acetyltransferase [Croceivirga thetidis]NKI33103.1 GNAT family N-acetyltransferase [Croceivirga thetidis]
MQIRTARIEDAEYIALLGRVTFTETFGHLFTDPNDLSNYLNQTFGVQKIRNSLTKENNVFWLAFVEELPVGYAKLKLNSPSEFISEQPICQLQKIYVLKDFLSRKIGKVLQDELLNHSKNLGFKRIWLSVLKSNKRAIGFYQKNGFELIGDHSFTIGKEKFDFQAMSKAL